MPSNDNQIQTKNKDFYNGSWHLTIENQVIEVTKDVYLEFKRPEWAEHKRKEREKRCRDEKGNRCTKSCRECDLERVKKGLPPIERTGGVLSLDRFTDEGFEVADTVDLAELIADKLIFEELYVAIEELDPDNRRIMGLFSIGKSEREIATDIGLVQKTINKRKAKLFAQLRERLKDII